jgi:hypothetical protein
MRANHERIKMNDWNWLWLKIGPLEIDRIDFLYVIGLVYFGYLANKIMRELKAIRRELEITKNEIVNDTKISNILLTLKDMENACL